MSERDEAVKAALDAVADLILRESLRCLMDHYHPKWGDRVPLDVFNRLLAKNIGPAGWKQVTHTDVQIEQISSRHERWTTAALAALPRGHSDPSGVDIACPIVIAEYQGEKQLLDGNHRINRWERTGDQRLHEVNIHTVVGVAKFVDLEPESLSNREHR